MKKTVILKSGRERSVINRHPWVFTGAVDRIEGNPGEGDLVEVQSRTGEMLGFGHSGENSIAVRMLSFGGAKFSPEFWESRISAAYAIRERLGLNDNPNTSAYRLFNAEGDGIPGLVIDRYADSAVVEIHSRGVLNAKDDIFSAVVSASAGKIKTTVLRIGSALGGEGEGGGSSPSEFLENGLKFQTDLSSGQKTGFFLDQRENRERLEKLAAGKSVLNAFAFTGGFSLYALRGGASKVDSVEISKEAVSGLERNLKLNGLNSNHQCITEDCFKFLKSSEAKYQCIVLDPPAFAKHRGAKSSALRAYESLNALGFERADRNALVLTFSCSLFVSRSEFREAVYHAASKSGRAIRVLAELQAGPDHPVSIYHREGEYLKGLFLQIE